MKRLLTAGAAVFLMMLALPAVSNAATSAYPPASTSGSAATTESSAPAGSNPVSFPAADGASLNVSDGTVVLSSDPVVTIAGSGFDPGETVNVTVTFGQSFHANVGAAFFQAPTSLSATADARGAFRIDVSLAGAPVGQAVITAVGAISGHTQSITVQVEATAETIQAPAAGAGAGGGAMPNTGVNSTMIAFGAIGGGLALVVGAGLVWLGASKRRGATHHA